MTKTSSTTTALAVLGAAALLVVVMPLAVILDGWVLSVLWGWFLVPLGMPTLTVPLAIGVALIASSATRQYIPDGPKDDKIERFVWVFLAPLLSLLIGWFVHLFV